MQDTAASKWYSECLGEHPPAEQSMRIVRLCWKPSDDPVSLYS